MKEKKAGITFILTRTFATKSNVFGDLQDDRGLFCCKTMERKKPDENLDFRSMTANQKSLYALPIGDYKCRRHMATGLLTGIKISALGTYHLACFCANTPEMPGCVALGRQNGCRLKDGDEVIEALSDFLDASMYKLPLNFTSGEILLQIRQSNNFYEIKDDGVEEANERVNWDFSD